MVSEDNATTTPAAAGDPSRLQLILQNIKQLSQAQKIAAAAAIAMAIAVVVGALLWSRQPDYAVLFSNIDERDGGQIIAALQQQNVPFKMSPAGNAILVPEEKVHETRLRLAAGGLPKGGMVGFELLDGQKLGISQFGEQVNYQRALEGELARTIQSIASVSSARVHLAIPKQTAFLRDDQKPTASVMVNLRPGRVLDASQVAGIVNLVSSSVPRLSATGVSIVNQDGELLTSQPDMKARIGLEPNQLAYVKQTEADYVERIDRILVPLFGPNNFRAQVAADIDFNEVEQTSERFKPNPAPDQAIRSQQLSEQTSTQANPIGVPGALSNQPPVPATAPITSPPTTPAGGQTVQTSSRSSTTNYELDRSIEHVKRSVGQIRRLSVAVVLNEKLNVIGADGSKQTRALSEEEIARITNLVREAVGYSASRGDTIAVTSSGFTDETTTTLPLWKDPEMLALAKELLTWLMVLLTLGFLYFALLRPVLRAVLPPPPAPLPPPAPALPVADATPPAPEEPMPGTDTPAANELPPTPPAPQPAPFLAPPPAEEDFKVTLSTAPAEDNYEGKLERARELARNEPRVVADLIKQWIAADAEEADDEPT